eukprot:s515_g20.t1
MLALTRLQFPLVLCYGITVHKSQGLTFPDGCVFNMQHEPTWSPCKSQPGLAFVGMSRTTDFALMAFKYVPDYWTFRSVAETDLFKWREKLEKRLDDLHDATACRNKRKVMRGDARDQIEETPVEEQVAESDGEEAVEEDDEEAYWRELMEEDAKVNLLIEAYYRDEED